MIYLMLYIEFFKIGLFAVGGGLATLPFLYQLSFKTGWFGNDEAGEKLCQCLAQVNAGGILGGIIATLGIVTPSVIVIIIVAGILQKFTNNKYVQAAFTGLRPAVCALITIAVWEIVKVSVFDFPLYQQTSNLTDLFLFGNIAYFFILLFIMFKVKLHPIIFIALSAALGFFVKF